MHPEISIEDYLAGGGRLTSPAHVPPRYRAELLRLMATFVDSALAGAAGFADIINLGPGIKERIAAARIVLEKTDHADQVLTLMGEFGVDTKRYANHHPWTKRLPRDAQIGATRIDHDMRLAVFNYPLEGWTDAVVMNLLMGLAVSVQLEDYCDLSYQPLADRFRRILPVEKRHLELAEEGLVRLYHCAAERPQIEASLDYWLPRVSDSFGADHSPRFMQLKDWGLRHRTNAALRAEWQRRVDLAGQRIGAPIASGLGRG